MHVALFSLIAGRRSSTERLPLLLSTYGLIVRMKGRTLQLTRYVR